MEISNRDAIKIQHAQSGQGVVEFLLVLLVTIAIVLGGVYQLNTAFRTWAENYFGNYLACLLETGELPSIGGSGGDSGICNQFFKPFSLQDGRPLIARGGGSPSGESTYTASGSGVVESGSQGSSGYGSHTPVRGGGASGGGARGGGGASRVGAFKSSKPQSKLAGSSAAKNPDGSYAETNRKLNTGVKEKLDTGFAFDNESETQQRNRRLASARGRSGEDGSKDRTIIRAKSLKKDATPTEDGGWSFGDFLRILIIAAIIIALVLLIGGQMLQVNKSME